jgi:hypothetical protein
MLVLIGATPEGKKELVGFQTGVRESAQSWRRFLDAGLFRDRRLENHGVKSVRCVIMCGRRPRRDANGQRTYMAPKTLKVPSNISLHERRPRQVK